MKESKYGGLKEENNNNANISIITEETNPDIDISISNDLFKITPKELTHIVELYKERTDNFGDIKYFEEQGGINKLLQKLDTDEKNGIKSIENREEYFGSNKIFIKPLPSFYSFLKEALEDKMIIILIISSIVEIGISLFNIFIKKETNNMDWLDGISIIIAIIVVVTVGSVTNYKKEMKFHDLNNFENQNTKYDVIRNGNMQELHSDDLLVGDLVKIYSGDILPADMVLIEGNNIKIDESSLTGESTSVKKYSYKICLEEINSGIKKPSSNILLCGTNVIEGNGTGIVIAIGEYSQKGIIRGTIDNAQEDNKTPLEIKLNSIADLIGYFGLGSAIVTFIALIIQLIIEYFKTAEMSFSEGLGKVLRILILCVSIIVVAIPEGLPLAVTLSLAFSIKKLMDKNNLVRKMHACETMGGANYICTDKTGTLTENKMQVISIITTKEVINCNSQNTSSKKLSIISASNKKEEDQQNQIAISENKDFLDILKQSIGLNVDYSLKTIVDQKKIIEEEKDIYEAKNKTDKAFIDFLLKFEKDINIEINQKFLTKNNFQKFPFDSQKKRMSIMIQNDLYPTGYRLYTKGGAENALIYCDKYINNKDGKIYNFTEEQKDFINNQMNIMNKKMMRTLFIGYKDITEEEYNKGFIPDENNIYLDQKNLIFVSIFCLRDSLRENVAESVDKCHQAHVNVIMVTGDNLMTATAIGKECHILPEFVDLEKLSKNDIEENPNEINIKEKKENHINELLINKPYAISGNSFFTAIEGIYCQTCGNDSLLCKCAKTEFELNELSKKNKDNKNDINKIGIKKDAIKNMENFKKLTKNLLILARAQPLHKYALVLGLKALGNIVAVTGDGTNDAPALSKSDVGFAMIDGTDISKDASDIVILDNNFSSIVTAIIYGRSIYENIRKFLQFQLTVNFCACFLVFICSCIGNETPLTSIQMLWVNLIMDSLGSLALATEPPYEELLHRYPNKKNESIINSTMWKHILSQSIFELILLVLIYIYGPGFIIEDKEEILNSHFELFNCFGILPGDIDYERNYKYILNGRENEWSKTKYINLDKVENDDYGCKKFLSGEPSSWSNFSLYDSFDYYNFEYGSTTHMTLIFNIFVLYTLFNQINCRILDDSLNICSRINKGIMFIIVTSCELIIQILIVQFGFGIFHCVKGGLSFSQWKISILFSLTTFIFNFIIKFVPLNKINLFSSNKKDLIEEVDNLNPIEMEMQSMDDLPKKTYVKKYLL